MLVATLAVVYACIAAPPQLRDNASNPCAMESLCALGRCTQVASDPSPTCDIGGPADCSISNECSNYGQCDYSATTRACVVATPETCSRSPACLQFGACHAAHDSDGGLVCGRDAASCRASRGCTMFGDCGYSGRCAPDSVDDCVTSRACAIAGACTIGKNIADQRACVATADACWRSERCALYGECTLRPNRPACGVGHDDCGRSAVCRERGWCTALPHFKRVGGGCTGKDCLDCGAQLCTDTEPCRRWGACTAVDGLCMVRAPMPVACKTMVVVGVIASASSTRGPSDGLTYDAGNVVDGDVRTAWVSAKGKGAGSKLTLRLPRPMRVTRVRVLNTFDLAAQSWLYPRVEYGVVRAGKTVEMLYEQRWLQRELQGVPVVLPATSTDTVELEVLSVTPALFHAEPAITELVIEACID